MKKSVVLGAVTVVATSAAVLAAAPAYAVQSATAKAAGSSASPQRVVIRAVSEVELDQAAASGFQGVRKSADAAVVCDLAVNNPHKSKGAKGKNIVIYKTRVTCDASFRAEVNGSLSAGVKIGPNPIVATSSGPTQSGTAGKVLTWYTPALNAAKQVTCEHGVYYEGYSTAVVTTGAITTSHSESSNRVAAC